LSVDRFELARCSYACTTAGEEPSRLPLASRPGPAIMAHMSAAKPPRLSSSNDVNAAIERVAPDVLALLADGVPRNRATIVTALPDRHPKQDVKRAIARLAFIGQPDLHGSHYTLPAPEAGQG
jgi:hypothetical protein